MFLMDNAQPFHFTAATAATHSIVAAVTGKQIFIWRMLVWSGGTVNINFEDGTTDFPDLYALAAQSRLEFKMTNPPTPYFITTSGNAFQVTLSGAVRVSGCGLYSSV